MKKNDLSRRKFLQLAGAGLPSIGLAGADEAFFFPPANVNRSSPYPPATGKAGLLTAGDVIQRIKAHVDVPWKTPTVDTIKGGNPDTSVTGITTTFMATLDVIQRSAAAGRNMIITHEPTFWNNLDLPDGLTNDPLYLHKMDVINRGRLVVWRFHDQQ